MPTAVDRKNSIHDDHRRVVERQTNTTAVLDEPDDVAPRAAALLWSVSLQKE